jgi:hypothetical protein
MTASLVTRRQFVAAALAAVPALAWPRHGSPRCDHGASDGPHPTPRPGIDASKVLKAGDLQDHPHAIAAFNEVRQIPQIIDGIRCQCGCATLDGYYSLLSCYEGESAMAKMCEVCQGQGRYAFRLHKAGKSLDEIRTAIEKRFG